MFYREFCACVLKMHGLFIGSFSVDQRHWAMVTICRKWPCSIENPRILLEEVGELSFRI